ncbi:SRPBCC domain-containing protein [Nocardioides sp. CN2-186]|uniref:SRPBCC domain-containing protein n=1 Tax=Nocardioides tweenelious TaxID=3156607 RepID=UPI0032B46F97
MEQTMELGTIERDIQVDASPEVVFEVVSRPEHIQEWWPDEADLDPVPGAPGEVRWRNAESGDVKTAELTVVDVDPPRRFSFRWCFAEPDRSGSSLLVTFDLEPVDGGTRIRMTETGFREMGWEAAVLEEWYADHARGWDIFIPRLGTYAERVAAS